MLKRFLARHCALSLALCLALSGANVAAQQNTQEFVLANGLKLIVREDHRAPVVVSQVWYRVGGSYEAYGQTGLSHALEHMMFKETESLDVGEFSRIMASVGAQENAFTNRDATVYYQVLKADRLALSFELEAERMAKLELSDDEFSREMQVVMEERRMRTSDNPQAQMYERFLAMAHQASPYGNPVVGWQEDLEALTPKDLRQWYQAWYAPNNATLIVVGDVQAEAVLKLAQQYFGDIASRPLATVKPLIEVNNPGQRRISLEHANAQLPTLMMGFNVPTLGSTHKEDWEPYALRMLVGVLDGGYSARIETQMIRQQGLASSAGAQYGAVARGDSLFMFSGVPSVAKGHTLSELEAGFWQQIHAIQQQAPTADELQRVRAQLISTLVYAQDSIAAQAQRIGSMEMIGQSWRLLDSELERIEAITPEQIQDVAQRYLRPERLSIAELKPATAAPSVSKLSVSEE